MTGWNPAKADRLVWSSAATAVPLLRDNLRHIAVRADQGVLTVTVDGVSPLNTPIILPKRMIVGFTTANGTRTDRHVVSNIEVSTIR